MKKFLLLIIFLVIFFPLFSLAATYQVGGTDVCYEGLVPCGKNVSVGGTDVDGACQGGTLTNIPCQLCHIFVMIEGILDFVIFQLVPVIAVLLLTAGGVMYLVSRGNPGTLTQAMSIIKSTMIGLVIIYASWMIVNTVLTALDLAAWTGDFTDKWFEIQCRIDLP